LSESLPRSLPPDTLSDITSTCVRNVRKSAFGHRVELMLKHCPILPQGVSENRQPDSNRTHCRTLPQHVSETSESWQPDRLGHVVRHNLNMCPKRPKVCSRTVTGHVVRHSLNMCPKRPKVAAGHSVGVMLNMCPINLNMCPEFRIAYVRFWRQVQHSRNRTVYRYSGCHGTV